MKCDMNCAACTRPAKKCHGGSYRTPLHLPGLCADAKAPRGANARISARAESVREKSKGEIK